MVGSCYQLSELRCFSCSGPLPPVCSGTNKNPNRTVRISKAPRIGLLTGDTTSAQDQILIEAFNSWENRHGEYIKAISYE